MIWHQTRVVLYSSSFTDQTVSVLCVVDWCYLLPQNFKYSADFLVKLDWYSHHKCCI